MTRSYRPQKYKGKEMPLLWTAFLSQNQKPNPNPNPENLSQQRQISEWGGLRNMERGCGPHANCSDKRLLGGRRQAYTPPCPTWKRDTHTQSHWAEARGLGRGWREGLQLGVHCPQWDEKIPWEPANVRAEKAYLIDFPCYSEMEPMWGTTAHGLEKENPPSCTVSLLLSSHDPSQSCNSSWEKHFW